MLMMPLLPFIEDTEENILGILHKARQSGADFVYPCFSMTLRSGQREYFYQQLDRMFPGVSEKYIKAFGGDYGCPSPKYHQLKERFIVECEAIGMMYRYRHIARAYKEGYVREQLSWI